MKDKVIASLIAFVIVAAAGWAWRVENRLGDESIRARLERLELHLEPVLIEYEVRRRMAELMGEDVAGPPPATIEEEAQADIRAFMMEQRTLPPAEMFRGGK